MDSGQVCSGDSKKMVLSPFCRGASILPDVRSVGLPPAYAHAGASTHPDILPAYNLPSYI